MPTTSYQSYDHRLKEFFIFNGNQQLASSLNIPTSTVKSWQHRELREVQSLDSFDQDKLKLISRIFDLQNDIQQLESKFQLLNSIIKIFQWKMDWTRLPKALDKTNILKLVESCKGTIPLSECLETINLSKSRYHHWKRREKGCDLTDHSSCPKFNPNQLTHQEISTMREMVEDKEYAHIPTYSLSFLAIRLGKICCSPQTWYQKIKKYKWSRKRVRKYPAKPKIGIRATRPDQYWHLDVTILNLLDGTKGYIHAVIDNFSSYVLAWHITWQLSAEGSKTVLRKAMEKSYELRGEKLIPQIIADSGSENINDLIDKMVKDKIINRTIAQIDIDESNSKIEAMFRSLKYNHLYNIDLKNNELLVRETDFYLQDHNDLIPHSALKGATPLEIYTDEWEEKKDEFNNRLPKAKLDRQKFNKSLKCSKC